MMYDMYLMAGKGSKPRTGANHQAYWDNYDKIFSNKKIKTQEKTPQTNGK